METENKEIKIFQGKTEAFLISDRSLRRVDAPFFEWLRSEGFTFAGPHGNFGCWWAYANITRKQYAYGMPGVALVKPIGNHDISIDEFKTIYSIYKRYEDKALFHSDKGHFGNGSEQETE